MHWAHNFHCYKANLKQIQRVVAYFTENKRCPHYRLFLRKRSCSVREKLLSRFQIFAVLWMFHSFLWVIPRSLNFMCRLFLTPFLFHLHWCSETSAQKIQKPGDHPKQKNTSNVALLKVRTTRRTYLPPQYKGFNSSQRLHSIKTTHELKPHLDSNAPCNRVFLKHKQLNTLFSIVTAVFGSVRYCSMCWAKRIQSTDSIYVYFTFILILSYRLLLDRSNKILCSDLPTDSLHTFCPLSHAPPVLSNPISFLCSPQ